MRPAASRRLAFTLALLASAAAVALSLLPAPAVAQNLVTNGSFEQNSGNQSTTGPGWTFLGNVNYKNNEGATDGTFAAGYNGSQTSNTGIVYQTLTGLKAGTTYDLTLDYGNFAFNGPQQLTIEARNGSSYNSGAETIDPGSATIEATSEGAIASNGATVVVTDDTGSIDNPDESEFNTVSVIFTAHSASDTLVLSDTGDYTDRSDLIVDNVRVTAGRVTAVPEPSTWALLGVGMAGLGLALPRLGRTQQVR